MDAAQRLLKVLAVCCLCNLASHAQPAGPGNGPGTSKGPGVTIALTKLDVNDQSLELRYTIRNGSGHDVWVCDGIGFSDVPASRTPEVYLDRDQRTLVIRKRIEVPLEVESTILRDVEGRFVRIGPGQQRTDSLLLGVPVRRHLIVGGGGSFPGRATRLTLEIGFYDGDLPGTIRTICEIADKLGPADFGAPRLATDVLFRYFSGLFISDAFGGLSGFGKYWKEGSNEIMIPHRNIWSISTIDEPCLRITVEGLDIPYQGG